MSLRPDLVRTWAAGAGTVDREYVWHDLAQMWQTPEVGEQVMEAMTGDAMVDTLADQVGGREKAVTMASHIDDTMKECMLALYRSAAGGFGEWHDDVDKVLPTRPGVVFWGADDPYVTANFGERLAERTGAQLAMFADSGHWWPVTKPAEVAAGLEQLWAAPELTTGPPMSSAGAGESDSRTRNRGGRRVSTGGLSKVATGPDARGDRRARRARRRARRRHARQPARRDARRRDRRRRPSKAANGRCSATRSSASRR